MANERTENDALIEITKAAVKPIEAVNAEGVLVSSTPLSLTNIETLLPKPRRMRGDTRVDDLPSLKDAVEKLGGPNWVAYLVDHSPAAPTVIVVLNPGDVEEPGWQDFRVVLQFEQSDEFKAWLGNNDDSLSQTEFAEHIEEWLHNCKEPSGAEMLELVTNLEATKDVTFKSGIRLQDGSVKFEFAENVRTTLVIPPRFQISLPIYEGGRRVAIEARLRYRIESGKLSFRYRLDFLPLVLRQELDHIATAVGDLLDCTVIRGAPVGFR